MCSGKVATEEKEEVKERWQQYTEELYRRDPNVTDPFNEIMQEDEDTCEHSDTYQIGNQPDVTGCQYNC